MHPSLSYLSHYAWQMCSMYRTIASPSSSSLAIPRAASTVQALSSLGQAWRAADAELCMQMCILDGNAYDAKCLEAGQERDEDLEACSLLINNKQQALLVPSAVASHSPTAKVIVQLTVSLASHLPNHLLCGGQAAE